MIRRFILSLMVDRPALKIGLANFPAYLEESGKQVLSRAEAATDTPQNTRQLNHIVGIERWGQSRLRVALGEPLQMDEYNGYRPPRERTLAELKTDFQATRQETVALARQLAEADIPADLTIPHNQHGDFYVHSWLYYLHMHANLESRRLK